MPKIDLGPATAYAIAVEHGYEGTEQEFAEQLMNTLARVTAVEQNLLKLENFACYGSSWNKLKYFTQLGRASELVSVGDQITDTYTDPDKSAGTKYSQIFDVLDFRNVTKQDATTVPATIVGTHYTQLVLQQFSGYQALLYSETGLPAGTYNFEITKAWGGDLKAGKYQFTLVNALPAGGQIVGVKNWTNETIDTWTVSTYESSTSETVIETCAVTAGSEGVSLGIVAPIVPTDTLNVTINETSYTYRLNGYHQVGCGYNRWRDSSIRQYLNSDAQAGKWWTPQHVFDRAPTVASTKAGWLAGCTDDFKSALTPVKVLTAPPNALASAEGITFDETYDKVFLPSLEEHYIKNQGPGEGDAWKYWKDINKTTTPWATGVKTDELKVYQLSNSNSSTFRWMRSAVRGNGCGVRFVNLYGTVDYTNAAGTVLACAPVCAIC